MVRLAKGFGIAIALSMVLGCTSKIEKSDGGGILLKIEDFGTLPVQISADSQYESIDSITIRSVVKNPAQGTSELMEVLFDSYEVTYERADTGSRVPPRLVEYFFGAVDPGGTFEAVTFPYWRLDQWNSQVMKDFRDLGIDPETGSTAIRLKIGIRFFGHTVAGDAVETNTGYFSVEVI